MATIENAGVLYNGATFPIADSQNSHLLIRCPFTVCREENINNACFHFDKFISHLKTHHRVASAPDDCHFVNRQMYVGEGNMFRFKRDGPKSPFLLNCHGYTFIQHSFSAKGVFWFWLTVVGGITDVGRFTARLSAFHPTVKARKTIWSGELHHVNTNEMEVYDSGECLILPKSALDLYVDVDSKKQSWNLQIEIILKEEMSDATCYSSEIKKQRSNIDGTSILKQQGHNKRLRRKH